MKKQRKIWTYVLLALSVGSLAGQYASPLFAAAQTTEAKAAEARAAKAKTAKARTAEAKTVEADASAAMVRQASGQTGKKDSRNGSIKVLESETVIWNGGDLPDAEERFAGYVTQEMYAGTEKEIATFGNFGEQRLSGINKTLYQKLKEDIENVANGTKNSTVFEIPVSELGIATAWTAVELNISTKEEIDNAVKDKLSKEGYDVDLLFDCLLADCPYDLYWYDKTKGVSISVGYYEYYSTSEGQVTSVTLKGSFRFSMTVAEEYRSSGKHVTDTEKTAATRTAVQNAKSIVTEYADSSDYDKLVAYKEKICDLVSYNRDAASDSVVPYGDPWQLIWVFDNDPTTNVVCEGYAKAFQYLCDLTEFSGDAIVCYTVTGYLGAEAHMWNIVTMNDNYNYLVDVTNCDEGTIGTPDKLFLAGLSGSWDLFYTFTYISDSVSDSEETEYEYIYDDDATSLFGENILTLASSDYQQESVPDITVSVSGDNAITSGESVTLTAAVNGNDEVVSYQWYKDGQAVDGATGHTYTFSELSEGEHCFYVKVTVGAYSYDSPVYIVTVHAAPDITPPTDDTPPVDDTPPADDTPPVDDTPSADDTPPSDDTSSADITPPTDDTPSVDDGAAPNGTPSADAGSSLITQEVPEGKAQSLSDGAVFEEGVLRYRVINAAKKQAEVIGCQKNARNLTIPARVRASSTGEWFRVVSIGNRAFKNNRTLKKVIIGASVKKIGKQAFAGCKKLKSITIQTKKLKMNAVGTGAFRNINAKAGSTLKVIVPKKCLKTYKKLFRQKGLSAKAVIK